MDVAPPLRCSIPEKSYDGYIFDLDGTLADSMPIHYRAWCLGLQAGGGADIDFTWELFYSRAGMSSEDTIKALQQTHPNLTLDRTIIEAAKTAAFHELEKDMYAVHEVAAFARKLFAEGKKLSVASGSARAHVDVTLRRIHLHDVFKNIITPEDIPLGRGKPEPDMFLLAAQRMACQPAACVVFEDAEMGFEAARRAGMDYVAVAAPAPQPTSSPDKFGSSSLEGFSRLTSAHGRTYYIHRATGRGCWAAPGSAQAAAELKELEQMLAGGGRQQQSASSVAFYAKLVRLALLGILCAYTWMWFKKNVL